MEGLQHPSNEYTTATSDSACFEILVASVDWMTFIHSAWTGVPSEPSFHSQRCGLGTAKGGVVDKGPEGYSSV
jgi:hypothetical protein